MKNKDSLTNKDPLDFWHILGIVIFVFLMILAVTSYACKPKHAVTSNVDVKPVYDKFKVTYYPPGHAPKVYSTDHVNYCKDNLVSFMSGKEKITLCGSYEVIEEIK